MGERRVIAEFQEAFRGGPGVQDEFEEWRRVRHRIEDAERTLAEAPLLLERAHHALVRAASGQARAVMALALGPLAVLLEKDPVRLDKVKQMAEQLGHGAEGGAPPDFLAQLADNLLAECAAIRAQLREAARPR